jgi:hypothetical protein
MGYGLAIIDGVLGGVAGAGQGMADQALLEQKTQIEALRDQRLFQLRAQEHAANAKSDIAAKQAAVDTESARAAEFFKGNKLPAAPVTNTASATYDDPNNPGQSASVDSNTTTAMDQPSDRAQAAQYARKALETGRPGIIKAANEYQGDVLKAEDMDRKNTLEGSKIALEAGRNKYYDALAAKYQAETDVLAQGGKSIPAPMLQSKQDDEGHNYLLDTHSGAIGRIVPGQAETKAETHWFGADTPGKPATPMHVEWTTSDGTPIQGGIDALYPAWSASRNKQLGTKKPGGIIDAAGGSDDGSKLTREIGAQASADGIGAPASVAPVAAPAPGAVVKGYRFKGGNPRSQASWEKVR